MSEIMNIDGLSVEVTRKKIKRLNMRIKPPEGKVVISAPLRTPDRVIIDFVRAKRTWIDRNSVAVRERAAARPAPATPAEKARRRAALTARIAGRLPAIEQRCALYCSAWSVRDMHTRWGSCNTRTHHINFSLMLWDRCDEELDYVIIHELVHTKVDNHGPEFKSYMDALMPNWREVRRQLKER